MLGSQKKKKKRGVGKEGKKEKVYQVAHAAIAASVCSRTATALAQSEFVQNDRISLLQDFRVSESCVRELDSRNRMSFNSLP